MFILLITSYPTLYCPFPQYYSECHGVIYVVDSSDPENLAISAQTFSEYYRNCFQDESVASVSLQIHAW